MSRYSDDGTPDAWRKRFGRFGKFGLPVARFCAREGVSVASFYYWRRKLNTPGGLGRRRGPVKPRPERRAAFQPVTVVPAVARVSVHLPSGARIEVHGEDLDAIRAVVAEVVRPAASLMARAKAGATGVDGDS
jgi:hypothetical protein